MRRNLDLGQQAWAGVAGNLAPFDLKTLLSDIDGDAYGLESLLFHITLDLTTGVGGGCTGREILEWFSNLVMRGSVGVPIQGMNAYHLAVVQGGCLGQYSGIPENIAAAAANEIRHVFIVIPFSRSRSPMPDKKLPTAQAFKDATFLINCGLPR